MKHGLICAAAWVLVLGSAQAQSQSSQEQARQQLERQSLTLAEATEIVADAMDANHDHRISRAEWLAYWPAPTGISATYNPARDFEGYDHNHDGFLDRQEAAPALQDLIEVAQTDCDYNVDHIFNGADELACFATYATPDHVAPNSSAAPNQPNPPRASGTSAQPAPGALTDAQVRGMIANAIDLDHDHRISRVEWDSLGGDEASFVGLDLNRNGYLDGGPEAAHAIDSLLQAAHALCSTTTGPGFSADELPCLTVYTRPNPPQPPSTPPSASGRVSGPSASLTIDASLRVPGPGRVFAPVANTPLYLSSRDLEQTLATAGLTRPAPVDAWVRACRDHAPGCQQGMAAIRGDDPAARGLTDMQGHFTFRRAPLGHVFVVAIADIAPGHTLIWCVPVDIHPGENAMTLAGHNLYVAQDFTPR